MVQSSTDSSPVYSTTQVSIGVTDVNDNAPVFLRTSDAVSVSQNTLPGTVLYIAHAHDHDSGENGRVRYSLRNPRHGTFGVDRNLGTVTLNQSLLVSKQQSYQLEIVAEDGGEPALSSRLSLSVGVDRSAAEDSVAFETLVYQVEMGEGYRKDSRVIQVRAHRGRGSHLSNSGLSYALETEAGFPPAPFRIHPKSGWLYLAHSLDYETQSTFRFRVLATAAESSPAITTATAAVTVLVLDVNDNAPVFSSEVYYFSVSEAPSPQGLVGTVRALDADSGRNAQLAYILLSDGKFFRINAKTGQSPWQRDLPGCVLFFFFFFTLWSLVSRGNHQLGGAESRASRPAHFEGDGDGPGPASPQRHGNHSHPGRRHQRQHAAVHTSACQQRAQRPGQSLLNLL